MKFLKNTFFVGLTAISLATSAGVYAQQAANAEPAAAEQHAKKMAQMQQKMQQKMRAGMEQHRAQLHAQLKLTPQQEPAWKTFTEATKPQSIDRSNARRAEHQAMAGLSAPARMEKMLERSKERLARKQQHLDALKSFYAVLTPEQQKIVDDSHQRLHHRMKTHIREDMQKRLDPRLQMQGRSEHPVPPITK